VSARPLPLKVVDGLRLPAPVREALRPGDLIRDREGHLRRLPRFFYEIAAWRVALETKLTPNFALWELMSVDVREAPALRAFPRYVPCAVTLLAAQLQLFRNEVGTHVRVAANGGYRSPAHALTRDASVHCWGSAANVFSVGGDLLDTRETIERYAEVAARTLPGVWTRPYGHTVGFADDHLHLDLGYVSVVPHAVAGEDEPPLEAV
jgi:hypothetical protein